jgi:hypothetical protein
MTLPKGWAGSRRTHLERSEGSKRYMRERARADERRRKARLAEEERLVAAGIDPAPICRCETCPRQGPWTCIGGEDD